MFGVAWMKVGLSLDCLVTEEPHGSLEGLRVQDNMEWISLFPGNIQQLVWLLSFLANTSATIRLYVSGPDLLCGIMARQQTSACDEYHEELGPTIHGCPRNPDSISKLKRHERPHDVVGLISLATMSITP